MLREHAMVCVRAQAYAFDVHMCWYTRAHTLTTIHTAAFAFVVIVVGVVPSLQHENSKQVHRRTRTLACSHTHTHRAQPFDGKEGRLHPAYVREAAAVVLHIAHLAPALAHSGLRHCVRLPLCVYVLVGFCSMWLVG